ncbi:homeodomain-interacting protein kinase 1-like [Electrophorus electricus]|uniref:homeodomain-interacting protein kinase 1-like n=1 Tax=Electrophorus electricus TaxID=8005 RepID=UPI0015D0B499|nr:homeodomain-interacting protein kinase 1-like [Electrophorus electricus]
MDDHELNPFGFHEPSFRKVKSGKIINTEDSSSGISKKVKFESNYYLRSPSPRIRLGTPWPSDPGFSSLKRKREGEHSSNSVKILEDLYTPSLSKRVARSGTTTSSTQSIAYSGCTADRKSVGDCEYQLGQNGILCSASNSYEVLHFLGCGSFGHVAKCSKKDTNEMVAIRS